MNTLARDPNGNSGANFPPSLDDETAAWLQRLTRLLQDSDAEAADVVGTLQDRVAGTPLSATLARVASAVDAFDFDAALAVLQKGDF